MNPPSPQLIETLTRLELVQHRDFARCAGYVRQFARDLPTFDSVWVDGLVRSGTLSQFQARQIQAGAAESLRVGPWLILDRLQSATRLDVYKGRHAQTGMRATLSCLAAGLDEAVEAEDRLNNLLDNLGPIRPQLSCPPSETFVDGNNWWIVSPALSGMPLDGLLIRRGRFPADVVHLLAARLSHELAALHHRDRIHGDLRPANIRLTSRGHLELTHHGVLHALEPGRPLLARLPLEYFDGLAPERIEAEFDEQSLRTAEVYALGCLLWQLLVGRSPYPMADPLLKMAAHRSQRVPRVRDWAPETPIRLASLIDQATQRDPALRPTMDQMVSQLATPVTAGRDRLSRFLNGFESASPRPLVQHDLTAGTSGALKHAGQGALVTASLVLLGTGLWWGPGLWSNKAPIGPPQAAATTAAATTTQDNVPASPVAIPASSVAALPNMASQTELLPLPTPDSQGRVYLSGQQYRASALSSLHNLTLQGSAETPTEIIVDAEPLSLTAQRIRISNVRITCRSTFAEAPVLVTGQDLQLDQVRLTGEATSTGPLVHWTLANATDVTAGHLQVSDSMFLSEGDILSLQFPLQAASFQNVLQAGGGSLLSLHQGVRAGIRAPLALNTCTLRETGALVRWYLDELPPSGQLSLQGSDSIIANRPQTALIEFTAGRLPVEWEQHLQIAAEGLIVDSQASIAGYRYASDAQEFRPLAPKVMQVDGLLTGTVTFNGDNLLNPQDSTVRTADVPLRQANQQLGFEATAIR